MTSERPFHGKIAIVTGGGRGIGREHALALAAAGARLVVNDVGGSDRGEGADDAPAHDMVEEIRSMGGEAVADTRSVADWNGARAIVQTAVEAFGGLDILVNNAGISRLVEIEDLEQADWDVSLAVNLTGTAAMTHWASVFWRDTGTTSPRAIVNTSSPAGTNPAPHGPAYVAAKAAVCALTAAVAGPLARYGARVNAIAPIARTRLIDNAPDFIREMMNRRDGDFDVTAPGNVTPLVLHLASSACRFTGRVFGIEGGELFLFDGYSARQRFSSGAARWTPEALAAALADVDAQDRGFAIAPGLHYPGPHPTDEVLARLNEVGASS